MNKPKTVTKAVKPLTCTVNRATWARGKINVPDDMRSGGQMNHLLNGDNTRCCLGFLGAARGVPDEFMLDTAMPDNLPPEDFAKYPSLEKTGNRMRWNIFAALNDDPNLSEVDREAKLRNTAKENGFRFRFTGK
jgi:hypothetical protein